MLLSAMFLHVKQNMRIEKKCETETAREIELRLYGRDILIEGPCTFVLTQYISIIVSLIPQALD